MVSTDRCMMWGTYFYINQSTSFKQKNVFLVMATHLKKSQWDHSVSTYLLTEPCTYFIQSAQCSYALTQDISKISMRFEYTLYKLCGLLGVPVVTKRLISHACKMSYLNANKYSLI